MASGRSVTVGAWLQAQLDTWLYWFSADKRDHDLARQAFVEHGGNPDEIEEVEKWLGVKW